jgi:hypothetical protein
MATSQPSFLIRPRPLEGESLSSWRQRVGWANGYRLFPLEKGRLRRADPDLCVDPCELDWVGCTHQLSADSLLTMTLRGHRGVFVRDVASRQHAAWWLRAKYGGRSKSAHGSMFCSECLKEKVPYFRLRWRVALFTVCPQHGLLYLDACSHCGALQWPAACSGVFHLHPRFSSFVNCWRCGDLLSECKTVPAANSDPLEFIGRHVAFRWRPAVEVLECLRAICQLFIRHETRKLILQHGSKWSAAAAALGDVSTECAVEYLDVSRRDLLIREALGILSDWPTSFWIFAEQCRITRVHFCGARHLHPAWFDAMVDYRLARQNRFVRRADVIAVSEELRRSGQTVTKAAIRRKLNWQGEIPLDWISAAR